MEFIPLSCRAPLFAKCTSVSHRDCSSHTHTHYTHTHPHTHANSFTAILSRIPYRLYFIFTKILTQKWVYDKAEVSKNISAMPSCEKELFFFNIENKPK